MNKTYDPYGWQGRTPTLQPTKEEWQRECEISAAAYRNGERRRVPTDWAAVWWCVVLLICWLALVAHHFRFF